jgi:hypothetical protein
MCLKRDKSQPQLTIITQPQLTMAVEVVAVAEEIDEALLELDSLTCNRY